ncbi:MAG: 1-phosphofructokinase [Acetatifactor sp.]|nr:1-phosphofructokinase [Acetatifactor sp.]
MIYTVTFNPSLDYIVEVSDFKAGSVNRTASEKVLPGGKGVNVSIVLGNLGFSSTALGFTAGFTGRELEDLMKPFGCTCDFIRVEEGMTRINLKMMSGAEATEINGQGPQIRQEHIEALYEKLDAMTKDDLLVISGSIPGCLPEDMYEQVLKRTEDKQVPTVVDATGKLLMNVLKFHPFLIKPNHHELGEIFGVTLKTHDEVIPYAKKMQELGARNVLVSMGGEGAVLVTEKGEEYKADAIKGKVINTVGAGDSMVAGFIAGYLKSEGNALEAFKTGQAAGSASAFSENLATKPEVEELLKCL